MGMVREKQIRGKQVNVRLNSEDAQKFFFVRDKLHHETVSYSVRDLLRSGYRDIAKLKKPDVERLMKNMPPESSDEIKSLQLNVRLNADAHTMTEALMEKMGVKSVSKVIRNLIAIYHFTLQEQEQQQKAAGASK